MLVELTPKHILLLFEHNIELNLAFWSVTLIICRARFSVYDLQKKNFSSNSKNFISSKIPEVGCNHYYSSGWGKKSLSNKVKLRSQFFCIDSLDLFLPSHSLSLSLSLSLPLLTHFLSPSSISFSLVMRGKNLFMIVWQKRDKTWDVSFDIRSKMLLSLVTIDNICQTEFYALSFIIII